MNAMMDAVVEMIENETATMYAVCATCLNTPENMGDEYMVLHRSRAGADAALANLERQWSPDLGVMPDCYVDTVRINDISGYTLRD